MKCCWVCIACRENQYMKNEYTCENCPIGWRPSNNLTGCLQIPVKYIQWSETPSLVAIAISVIGLIMTLFTMVVFIQVSFVCFFMVFGMMFAIHLGTFTEAALQLTASSGQPNAHRPLFASLSFVAQQNSGRKSVHKRA